MKKLLIVSLLLFLTSPLFANFNLEGYGMYPGIDYVFHDGYVTVASTLNYSYSFNSAGDVMLINTPIMVRLKKKGRKYYIRDGGVFGEWTEIEIYKVNQ